MEQISTFKFAVGAQVHPTKGLDGTWTVIDRARLGQMNIYTIRDNKGGYVANTPESILEHANH